MTNGSFGMQGDRQRDVPASFGFSDLGLGSALAVVLFVSVILVMWINIRRCSSRGSGGEGEVNADRRSEPTVRRS